MDKKQAKKCLVKLYSMNNGITSGTTLYKVSENTDPESLHDKYYGNSISNKYNFISHLGGKINRTIQEKTIYPESIMEQEYTKLRYDIYDGKKQTNINIFDDEWW